MSTDDVDIVPALNRGNLDSLAVALNEMNARILSAEYPEGIKIDFSGKDLQKWIVEFRFLNLRTDYGRLDVIHRPGGTAGYPDLAPNAEEFQLENVTVRVAALEDIIHSKQAVGRDRDLAQLPTLRMVLERTKDPRALRPGSRVVVPWENETLPGVIVGIRGKGPAARATVQVQVPGSEEAQELHFPLGAIEPSS